MNFFNYSKVMEADLLSLEEKISKLITVCSHLHTVNSQLRDDLLLAQQQVGNLKNNMLLASNKLEALLEHVPQGEDA